jgi:predicted NUDIX family NTP pyrophosphohydrolase
MGRVPSDPDSSTARAHSAGIVLHRRVNDRTEVLLVHPGGPFWARRDLGVWSIPKGEYESGEDPLAAALREFAEELGSPAPDGDRADLGEIRQRGGKAVRAWAVTGDLDVDAVQSNTFELEWPPRSGRTTSFPEVDRAEWFELDLARQKIIPAQAVLLDRLADRLED